MVLIGAITWARFALLTATQFAGTIAAAYMVEALFNGGLHVSTKLGGDTSPAQGVVIEMILTSQLIFTIFMLAAEKHAATFLAPIGIGLSLFIGELIGRIATSNNSSSNVADSIVRCFLDRRFLEPSSITGTLHCNQIIHELPLDILGWTHCRHNPRCIGVQACQGFGVRVTDRRAARPGGWSRSSASTTKDIFSCKHSFRRDAAHQGSTTTRAKALDQISDGARTGSPNMSCRLRSRLRRWHNQIATHSK